MAHSVHNRIYEKLYDPAMSDKFSMLVNHAWWCYTDLYTSHYNLGPEPSQLRSLQDKFYLLTDKKLITLLGPRDWNRTNNGITLHHDVIRTYERNQTVLLFNASALKGDAYAKQYRHRFKKLISISNTVFKRILNDIADNNIMTDMTIVHLHKNSANINSIYFASPEDASLFGVMANHHGLV